MKTAANSGAGGGRRLAGLVLAAIAVPLVAGMLVSQDPAVAHDHRVPGTVLEKGARELQAGTRVFESSWNSPAGGGECVTQSAIYRTRFPQIDVVAAGSKLQAHIHKAQRPDSFRISAWRGLDRNGEPAGEGRPLGRTLERVVRKGKTVGWDAVFSVEEAGRDYYLVGEGHWQDRDGCPGDQFASWSFHVTTRS